MAKKKTDNVAEDATVVEPIEVPKVEIIRGRMPVAVVALIRFNETETSTAAAAAKYRTTVGKVDDIRKNRNFAYVDADFKPTEQQVADAKVYLEQLSGDDAVNAIQALENMGIAADASEFEAKRASMRKSAKKEAGEAPVVEETKEAPAVEETEEDSFDDADLEDLTE